MSNHEKLTVYSDTLLDPDVEATTEARSNFTPENSKFYPLQEPGYGAYFAELEEDLERVRKDNPHNTREDLTSHVIVNHAPRSKDLTKNGKNGTDFYCAVTESGVVAWVTPVEFLKYLNTRNKIQKLFRVPKNGSGFSEDEQFRSSVVPIFRYYQDDLIEIGDLSGVPVQENLLEKAYADRFGNIRASTNDPDRLDQEIHDKKSTEEDVIGLTIEGSRRVVIAHVTDALKHISDDIGLGYYKNIADEEWSTDSGYREFVVKSDNATDPRVMNANGVLAYLNGGKPVDAGTEIKITSPTPDALTVDEIVKKEQRFYRRLTRAVQSTWDNTAVVR